jgi:hypothetical protein
MRVHLLLLGYPMKGKKGELSEMPEPSPRLIDLDNAFINSV